MSSHTEKMYRKRERRGLVCTKLAQTESEKKELAYPPDILHRLAGGDKGLQGI